MMDWTSFVLVLMSILTTCGGSSSSGINRSPYFFICEFNSKLFSEKTCSSPAANPMKHITIVKYD